MLTIPLDPELVVPVDNEMCPLTPFSPAFGVLKEIKPLVVGYENPLVISMYPPVY